MNSITKHALQAATLAAFSCSLAFAQVYTTLENGGSVNANIYPGKDAVYLSGGPNNNCSQNGLAPGTYYFQITDPSGANLLSTDAISSRRVEVAAGNKVITAYTGSPATHTVSGSTSTCGSSLVQLMPYDNTPNNGGEYKLWLYGPGCQISDENLLSATAKLGDVAAGCAVKTDNFKVRTTPGPDDPTTYTITGVKFYDANLDGIWQQGTEPTIPGWQITKNGADLTVTNINGEYGYINLLAGPYTIAEILPSGSIWYNNTPLSVAVSVPPSQVVNFGNVCVGAGGGLTLGFWSNRNGQSLFGADDLAAMVALNLRNANGSAFDPADYAAFRTWILSATATNMSYMLSAQLAAMQLNVLNGKVNGASSVYAPGANGASAYGFITVNALIAEADAALAAKGSVLSGDPDRAYYEALKNALDNANNNRNFVQSSPANCPVVY